MKNLFLLGAPQRDGDEEAIALESVDANVSVAELRNIVSETAGLLAYASKSLIFLFCSNDPGSVVAYLSGVTAGHAVALIDPNLSAELVDNLIDVYLPELVIAEAGAEIFDRLGGPEEVASVLGYRYVRYAPIQPEQIQPAPIHEDLAVLLSTSGTTGSPKFVRLSKEAVFANAASIAEALGIDSSERPITSLPPFYSYGLSVINSHLLKGATVILTNESVISKEFWELFDAKACTSFAGVPYTYQMLRRIGFLEFALPSLTTLTQAGGKLESSLTELFADHMHSRGGKFFTMYGQTEATARIAILPAEAIKEKLGSAGIAIPGGNVQFEIDGRVADGEEGELVYQGPNVMMGYAVERADLARGDELGGRLETGDLGHLDDDGYVFITGRSKRIAKVFGLRINLDEVEALLKPYGPGAIVGGENELIAYCEFPEDHFDDIRKALAARLKVNRRAFRFIHVESLPLTGNGKIDYKNLPEAP